MEVVAARVEEDVAAVVSVVFSESDVVALVVVVEPLQPTESKARPVSKSAAMTTTATIRVARKGAQAPASVGGRPASLRAGVTV